MSSAVLAWPDAGKVLSAARAWAVETGSRRPEVRRILCFGSAVKGTWGPGSDLDILLEVSAADRPFPSRSLSYRPPDVPVPVEILVYTSGEIRRMRREGFRFIRDVDESSAVLFERSASPR